MNDVCKYADINLSIDKDKLCASENFMLKISIKNKSKFKIENGLFRLNLDLDVFNILDEKYKICINDFGYIETINPNSSVDFAIPIGVVSVPKELSSTIFAYLNFHIIENGNLVDLNCNSNEFDVKFLDLNIINEDNFKISSSKERYLLEEDMGFTISIKNTGNYPINNIKIYDYIPENTYILEDSITLSNYENIIITGESLILTNLNKDEEIFINYKVSINKNTNESIIKVNPKLTYVIDKIKKIESLATPIEVFLENMYIFDEDSFKYTIDKDKVFTDDIITHSINIYNSTNINISNLTLNMNSEIDIDFVNNSLMINDIYRVEEDINDSIYLGDLDAFESILIIFKTKVSSKYKDVNIYFDLNYNTSKRSITQRSNFITYNLLGVIFNKNSFIKRQNKENYKLGEIIDFSIEITNLGNIDATNVILYDKLLPTLELIPGSISINNIIDNNIKNTELIYLETLVPNKKTIISYKAKSIDICTNKKSSAYITYCFDKKFNNLKEISNEININIIGAKIGNNNIKRELSSYTSQIGDKITTKLIIENTGNLDCTNLKLNQPINNALEFVENSLIINNKIRENENIFKEIEIPILKPSEKLIIEYDLKVLDFPKPNPIADKVTLTYNYIFNNKQISNTIYSSKSKIYVNNPNLCIVDMNSCINNNVYTKFCNFEDYIFYNLVLENTGNVGIENISLYFDLPEDLILDKSTLKVNNCIYHKNFDKFIDIPNLNVSQKVFLEFYVKHSYKKDYNLKSIMKFEYTFRDLKDKVPFTRFKKLEEDIIILKPDLEIEKFVSNKDLEMGREFTKNINIKNTGNILLEDIKFKLNEIDILRNSESSVSLNGNYIVKNDIIDINKLDVNESAHISIRYNLEDIDCCELVFPRSEVSASYRYNNNEPIAMRRKSDFFKLNIKNYHISIKGKSSLDTNMIDTKYTYIFSITNDGNVDSDNCKLSINLGSCIEYIDNSICLNGRRIDIKDISQPVDIGNLRCNESIIVSFDFIATSIPFKNTTLINATLDALYNVYDSSINKTFESNYTSLNIENLSVDIVTFASHDYLQSGDVLKIQTIIDNTGTMDVVDLVLKDNVDENLTFVNNSVFVNGENIVDVYPRDGIILKDLKAGKNILISYDYEYIPKVYSEKVTYFSEIDYFYILNNNERKKISSQSEPIYIEKSLSIFKQFSIENEYILNEYEPDMYDVVNVFSDAQIDNFYEIDSIENKSYDNSNSTGKKVIIKGHILDTVEYLVKGENSSLYAMERNQPFTTFINLPKDYNSENLYFRARYEDVFYKIISSRGIFVSSLISIEGLL